ncbi:MAG: amino acid ABC transporter substrate-binding protein [Halanaeroarchaeum sp.]
MASDDRSDAISESRRKYLAGLGAAGIAGIAGCGGNGGNDGSSSSSSSTSTTTGSSSGGSKTLTLGAAISQTGELSKEGGLYLDSYKMTIQDVNDQGGLDIDGTTYEFDLKTYDDQSDPSKSRQLFQKLIEEDDVQYLLGPYSSGVTLAAQPVVQQHKLPMVEGGGSSTDIFSDSNEYVFGTLATAPHYADGVLSLADTYTDPEVQEVALAYQNDIFSKGTASGVRDLCDQYGWDVVVDESFPSGANDLSSILNKVKNADPQVFVVAGHYKHAVLAVKQMKQYGVDVPMTVETVGATTSDFIDELGDSGNYVYGTSQWASNANYDGFFYGSAPDYVERFGKMYDYSPDYHNASGSACILTYLNAFKQAGSTDPGAVRDALANTDITTFFGSVKFGSNGANVGKKTVGYQWQKKKKKLVAPKSIAAADPVYPAPTWSER